MTRTYISLLRGVNVGGRNKINRQELIEMYSLLGFANVTPYIQSGNVVFKYSATQEQILETRISAIIRSVKSYEVPAFVIESSKFAKIISSNPFNTEAKLDLKKVYFTFFAAGTRQQKTKILQQEADRYQISGNVVYLHIPGSYARTKLSNRFFEKMAGVAATTRNGPTSNKLLEIAAAL